jgi:hypothetical protein
MTTGVRSGTDLIGLIRLVDLRLHWVVCRHIMETEQIMESLLSKVVARMDANRKAMQEMWTQI